ncbi:MAG: Tfp pilus assembly protein FimT/FimU [Opitutales bacterium]
MSRSKCILPRARGFTIIELLTVIALMAVLAGIVVAGLGGFGGATVPASQRSVAGLIDAARTTAQVRQSDAYLLIYAGQDEPSKYLRYMGIVWVERMENGENVIHPVGDGTYLPEGTYVIPRADNETPVSLAAGADGELYESDIGGTAVEEVAYPQRTADPDRWFVLGFESSGQTTLRTLSNPNTFYTGLPRSPVIVISPGIAEQVGSGVELRVTDPFSSAAVFVRPNGQTVMMNDFQEISDTLDDQADD